MVITDDVHIRVDFGNRCNSFPLTAITEQKNNGVCDKLRLIQSVNRRNVGLLILLVELFGNSLSDLDKINVLKNKVQIHFFLFRLFIPPFFDILFLLNNNNG